MPTVDLLVIGGGIHGTCVARDAALRGLSVVLVEKDDLASGTSSRSSKLIHGGLRYLETGQFGLVREALRERAILLATAQGYVRPLKFCLPFYRGDARPRWLVRVGLTLYDVLARSSLGPHRMLSRAEALATVPTLPQEHLTGAAMFHDAQMDDAGLVVANAMAAAQAGASIRTHLEVQSLVATGAGESPVWRAGLANGDTVDARCVVNAAGPWVDLIRSRTGSNPAPALRLTRGTHVVLPSLVSGETGLLLFARRDGRVFFVLPWYGRSLVGTTDVDDPGTPDSVSPTASDVRYLWNEIRSRWPAAEPEKTTSRVFAGLRPLARSANDRPWDNPREARLLDERGLISMVGGKYTTARHLAERTVDRVVARLDTRVAPCATASTPLPSPLHSSLFTLSILPNACMNDELEAFFTTEAIDFAIDHQFAQRLGDVIFRRSIFWVDSQVARHVAPTFADRMAERLGWDAARRDAEIALVNARLDEEEQCLVAARTLDVNQ